MAVWEVFLEFSQMFLLDPFQKVVMIVTNPKQ